MHALQARHEWPQRTERAILARVHDRGLRLKRELNHFNGGTLAELLGISSDRVLRWVHDHGLSSGRKDGQVYYAISRKAFKCWAVSHRHLLGGISQECLEWVLGDAELAAKLYNPREPRQGKRRRLRRKGTKLEYSSIAHAAASIHVSPTALGKAIKNGSYLCAGIEWEEVS